MNILLIAPPAPFLEDAKCNIPLGICYLAGAVKKYMPEENVELLDLGNENMDYLKVLAMRLLGANYDVIGISINTVHYPYALEIINLIRMISYKSTIVVGGSHVTVLAQDMQDLVDCTIRGEGEAPFITYLTQIKHGGNMISPLPANPDVPDWYPARELLPYQEYTLKLNGTPCMPVMTSRGCPNCCPFCMQGTWKKFRLFPVKYVQNELEHIKHRLKYNSVGFIDDTFTYDAPRVLEISRILKRLKMTWKCWTRVDTVEPTLLDAMKDCGCQHISFGIESGVQFMLDRMCKHTTVAQNTRALKLAKHAGIKSRAYFMIGFPGETPETIQQTTQYIIDQDIPEVVVFTFTPTVGCPTWANPEKYGILGFDKMDFEHQWRVGLNGHNAMYIDTKWMSGDQLRTEHLKMIDTLKDRLAGAKK